MTRFARGATVLAVVLAGLVLAGLASAWAAAQKIDTMSANNSELNTPSLDGCPIQSPDGLSLYIASNRPGGKGGLDIWMASRASSTAPWGAPQNLGEPVNSPADDFCPTPVGKKGLFFVSREPLPGACGQGDIYFTHRTGSGAWSMCTWLRVIIFVVAMAAGMLLHDAWQKWRPIMQREEAVAAADG